MLSLLIWPEPWLLLSPGPRTNPWFSESSMRVIEAGDMVSFDTDESGHFFSLTKRGWNYLYTSGITAAGPFIDKSHKSYWVYNIKLYQSL